VDGNPCLWVDFYRDRLTEFESEELAELSRALGREPETSVVAEVSGRHAGDEPVRHFVTVLLAKFAGLAQDDFTGHYWTSEEVASSYKGQRFLRRFLQHVLPRGFVKVRHYGLLSNSGRETKLALCRWLLTLLTVATASVAGLLAASEAATDRRPGCCPECGVGQMVRIAELPRPTRCAPAIPVKDTS